MRDGVRVASGQRGGSTDVLIDALVADLSAAPPVSLRRILVLSLLAGGALSAAAMLLAMGLRPDFSAALATVSFWVKLAFPLGLALAGLAAMDRLGRPGAPASLAFLGGAAVAGAMGLAALGQLMASAPHEAGALLLGTTVRHCTVVIVLLALPVFASGLYAMRRMAPTRLALAGAAVGVTAGAISAFVYSYACYETALPFIALWYGGGIAVMGVIGALLGPRLLRW